MKSQPPAVSFAMRSLAAAVGMLSGGVYASTLVVANLNDSGEGSLREALTIANDDGGVASTISFSEGLKGTISLQSSLPIITDSVDISGTGITIKGPANNAPSVIMRADNGTEEFAFRGLTFTGSKASSLRAYLYGNGSGVLLQDVVITKNDGGTAVVILDGDLELQRTVISNNRSVQDGDGGGIRIRQGDLVVSDSQISNNFAELSGAGIFASNSSVTISRSQITGNTSEQKGGGIVHYGSSPHPSLTIEDSEISGNKATAGAGIFLYAHSGNLNISRSSVTGNVASNTSPYSSSRAGGISFETRYSGEGAVSISDSVVAENTADRVGGLLVRTNAMTIHRTLIADNVAKDRDGGFNLDADDLTISESIIRGNKAPSESAGEIDPFRYDGNFTIERTTISGHSSANGRVLDVFVGYEGSIQVSNSTISGNTARDEAVSIRSARYDFGQANIVNSTFSGNKTTRSQSAIELINTNADISHSTFVNNSAALPSSVTGNTAQVSIHNTRYYNPGLVSATVDRSVFASKNLAEMQVGGQVFSNEGGVFSGSASPVFLSVNGPTIMTQGLAVSTGTGSTSEGTVTSLVDPLLQPLGYRGGFTMVHEPKSGSPVLDAGGEGSRPDFRDQRGLSLIVNTDKDLGSVEYTSNVAPRLAANLAKQISGKVGDEVPEFSLPDLFVDDDGDTIFDVNVTGLPSGLNYNEGRISGTLTTPGTFHVTAIVGDANPQSLRTVEQLVVKVRAEGTGGSSGGGSIPAGVLALFGFLALFRRSSR
jgi:hypothetical protein